MQINKKELKYPNFILNILPYYLNVVTLYTFNYEDISNRCQWIHWQFYC